MPDPSFLSFPKDFLWGAATAAYQIEGHTRADGRGESIWDVFCRRPGVIEEGANGEPACDHYVRWPQDIALMKSLGLQSYRLSVAWPRILPGGTGNANAKGLDFYERLVDALLEAGIKPNLTLYHWDLPQALEDKGGWAHRDTAKAFADYTSVVLKRLGDRPLMWSTFNEPWCVANLGYGNGSHAPGRQESPQVLNQVIHHILLAHGLSVQRIRDASKDAKVGIVIVPVIPYAADETPLEQAVAENFWAAENDWWMHPLLLGKYPEQVWKWKGVDVPIVEAGDLETIAQPMDWLGLNFYFPTRVKAAPQATPLKPRVIKPPQAPTTAMPGWEIYPDIAERVLTEFSRRYPKLPLYVSENGAAFEDPAPDAEGRVADPRRLDYIRSHLASAHRAIAKGVDLKGWYVWSLMDNFEWRFGYGKRFGIVRTDYENFERTVKDSGRWYADSIRANGFSFVQKA